MASGDVDRIGFNDFWGCALGQIPDIDSFARLLPDRLGVVGAFVGLREDF